MMDYTYYSLDNVSSALVNQETQRAALANSALSRGADLLVKKNYEGAVVAFKQAAAFRPGLLIAWRNIGQTYALMGRTDDAIAAYKRAVQVDPTSTDARNDLATYLMKQGRYVDAEQQFLQLAKTNPTWAGPAASLGYIYMNTNRLSEAEVQFTKAVRQAPKDASAYYSLGLLYNNQGRYEDAVRQFDQAIALNRNYAVAYADLAYSYIGMDQTDQAQDQVKALFSMDTDESNSLATEVQAAMYKPRLLYQDLTRSTFNTRLGPGTPLEDLDPSLATPGAVKTFALTFQFNRNMDVASVQSIYNWSIAKASGGEAGVYNYGANLHPEREVGILPYPTSVRYDPLTLTATIYFKVTQNASGNGVIDPSHWVFKFTGTDSSGNAMDPHSDQYDWSGGVF